MATNKCALVAGVSGGLGTAFVSHLLASVSYERILGIDILQPNTPRRFDNQRFHFMCANLANPIELDEALRLAQPTFDAMNLDLLVCCSGRYWRGTVEDCPTSEIDRLIGANFVGPTMLVSRLLPYMFRNETSTVVLIGSNAVTSTKANQAIYNASKHGLQEFARRLRDEVRPRGCNVILVHPGGVRTGLYESAGLSIDTRGYLDPNDVASTVLSNVLDHREHVITEMTIVPPYKATA